MDRIKAEVSRRIVEFVRDRYQISLESPGFLFPPAPELGDLALPVAFDLAKLTKQPPRLLAGELAGMLSGVPGLQKAEVAGGGYVNLYFHRPSYARFLFEDLHAPPAVPSGGKVIVEHTNINPNKAAHIGHLRNAALGDTLARCLRFLGRRVEVQNYIDDTGVQVADLIIGITRLEKLDLDGVRRLESELERTGVPLDHYCWDLYSRVTEMYERSNEPAAPGEKSLKERLRGEMLHDMEEGSSPLAEIAAYLADKIVRCHLATMQRIDVRYDLLPRESDILSHRFWEKAFERLKSTGKVTLSREGKSSGCWVMDLSGSEDLAHLAEGEKILVRSNGTVTYVGKDIAYQLWKFGLLGADFDYRPYLTYPNGKVLWSTSREGEAPHPSFGNGETIYNVIDVRQSYLQQIVVESLRLLGAEAQARRSIHFAYEMVALSPRCANEMGIAVGDEDRLRPFLEMSGRKGIGVKADDLLDNLIRRAEEEVRMRNADLPGRTLSEVSRAIAVGALRYYMLRFTRNKVIAFDFADALSFDGETGPYVQYAVVRSAGILGKVAAALGMSGEELPRWAADAELEFLEADAQSEEWDLLSLLGRHRTMAEQAVAGLEFSSLAKYAFVLAQKFNGFYHRNPVLQESDPQRRRGRVLVTYLFRRQMTELLDRMGIPVPSLM